MSAQRNLILGAGMAGVSGAESMRQAGFDGEILMIGDERELPYHRPPLSKALPRSGADSARGAGDPSRLILP